MTPEQLRKATGWDSYPIHGGRMLIADCRVGPYSVRSRKYLADAEPAAYWVQQMPGVIAEMQDHIDRYGRFAADQLKRRGQ